MYLEDTLTNCLHLARTDKLTDEQTDTLLNSFDDASTNGTVFFKKSKPQDTEQIYLKDYADEVDALGILR